MKAETLLGQKTSSPASAPAHARKTHPRAFTSLSLLEKFQPQENSGKESKAKIDGSRLDKVKQIEACFEKALNAGAFMNKEYGACVDAIGKRAFSAREIEDFSLHGLVKFEDHPNYDELAGYFLSALVNYSSNDKCVLRLPESSKRLDHVADTNLRDLTIYGSVGAFAGAGMAMGKLEIFGDAGSYLGNGLEDGKILLHGNSEYRAGCSMLGGSIVIFGNADSHVGSEMGGGQIVVYGECGASAGSSMLGGKLILRKNCWKELGSKMRGGEIFVIGNAGPDAGDGMTGGRIAVYGNVDRAAGILMEGGELAIFGSTGAGAGAFMKGGILRVQKKLFLHTIIRGGDIYQGDTQIVRDGIVIRRPNNK